MFWSFLFVLGCVQGSFLILVFSRRKNANPTAARLLQAILAFFVLSNFDDLLLSTGWFKTAPWMFGWSFAALLAYGPLFWFYIKSSITPDFCWKPGYWIHFLPAGLFALLSLSFLFLQPSLKVVFLENYLAGTSAVRSFDQIVWAFQILHLSAYGVLCFLQLRRMRENSDVSLGWLWLITGTLLLIELSFLALVGISVHKGAHLPGATYVFTLFTSGITYYLAFKLILHPESVTPGFALKYKAPARDEIWEQALLSRLEHCMQDEKPFADPELKLATLARRLDLQPYRLSGLINQHYGVSFSEFIARRRVQEFLSRLGDERFAHLSLYGLAMEVGFNSKSAFNAAFKRVTGKNPSDYKR